MIQLDTRHPAFDMDLELLSLLPVAPWFVPREQVQTDLLCDGHEITNAIERLGQQGIRIIENAAGELAIARESYADAKMMAMPYVDEFDEAIA